MKNSIMAFAFVVAMAGNAFGQSEAVTVDSNHSVIETASRLEAAIKAEPGFVVLGRLDYQSIAASQGGKVRPSQLVLFGRGQAVQTLLTAAPTLGLDLPLKILVWEGNDGKVHLTHNSAEFLKRRHNVKGIDPILNQITQRMTAFATKASQ